MGVVGWLGLAVAVQPSEAFASANANWAAGIEATLPAGTAANPVVLLKSVSCPSAGNCSAVGVYRDGAGHFQGLLLTESAGTWAARVEATLPAGAATDPDVSINSVSCPSAGNCGAVGVYRDSSNHYQGLLLTESAGTWAAGVEATLPAGAATDPGVNLSSVSCPSAGNCSAVGWYADSSGHQQGLLLTESAETWTAGVEATLPAGAATDPSVNLHSVSCASAGNCGAVGSYIDSAGHTQGVLLAEGGGVWAAGVEATLPAGAATDPDVSINSVSCASAANCSAVGNYIDSAGYQQGVLLTESGGVWAPGIEATLPPGATANPIVSLRSVSCPSAGNCGAVGGYRDSSGGEGMLLTESGGAWAPGIEATLPAGAAASPVVSLGSVSCPLAGNCSAVGSYIDSAGHRQAVLLTESAGTWVAGLEATLPAGAATDPSVIIFTTSVSCPSAGNCSAVGSYIDSASNRQGVLLSTLRRLTVLKRGSGRGSVTSSPAGINCGASCSHGFDNGRAVTLTARPARGSRFAGWSGACSGSGGCRVKLTADRTVTARFALLPPNTKITKAKIDKAHHRAKFKFKARGKSTGFQCALVKKHKKANPHFSSCRSPKTHTGLAPGGYTFFVRAFNAGGPDPTPAKRSFKL